jgi:hypothetical protein
MSDPEDRKAEIEADILATRAELAETADALAAKLDVKAQASHKVHEAGERVTEKYSEIKEKAPEPVQKALDKTGQAVSPLVAQAAADKRRTLIVLGSFAVLLVVVRRMRARRGARA